VSVIRLSDRLAKLERRQLPVGDVRTKLERDLVVAAFLAEPWVELSDILDTIPPHALHQRAAIAAAFRADS